MADFEQAGLQLIAQGAPQFFGDMTKASSAMAAFGSATDKAGSDVTQFAQKIAANASKIDSLKTRLGEQQIALRILQQELSQTADKYGATSIQAQKKALALLKLNDAIKTTEQRLESEQHALQANTEAMGKAQTAAATAEPKVEKLGNAAKEAGDDAERGGHGFDAFSEIVTGALRKVGEIAVDALARAGEAIAHFAGDSIGVAGDFEAGMNKFRAAAGKGVDTTGLEQFRDLFIQLGRELPVSTQEVQDAATEMVTGGIDPAIVAAGGLRQTIQFAAAAQLSLADAAGTSAKLLAGWVDPAANATTQTAFLTSATDDLTKAAAASSTTVAELRLGIFNVQGAAQALHAPFQDVVATLAELAPAFESSAQAGTALNVFMSRLEPQTSPAAAAMQKLGIITKDNQNLFFDAQGNFLGMANAAQVLRDHMSGLSDEQKISALHTLFGNDAMKVGNLLMQQGAAGVDAMKAKMADANGVAGQATIMQSGYNTALENAKGSLEALQITVGSKVLPILTELLNNTIAPGINTITTFADSLFSAEDPLAFLVAQADTLSPILGTMVAAIGDLIMSGGDLGVALDDISEGFGVNLAPAIQTALPVIQQIASFVGDNLTPILFGLGTAITVAVVPAIVAAVGAFLTAAAPIAALVAAGALLYQAWTTDFLGIQTTVTTWWTGTLQPIFGELVTWLQTNVPIAIQSLSQFWTGTLWPAIQVVANWLQGTLFPIIGTLVNVWLAVAKVEIAALAAVWTNVLWPALQKVWAFLNGSVIPIFGALFNVAFAIAKKEVEALAGLWEKTLWPALQKVWAFLQDNIFPALKATGDLISNTLGPILTKFTVWLGDVTGGFEGMGNAVQGVIDWLNNLASSIDSISLPDWMTPGSPTPLEIGLWGIADAMKAVAGLAGDQLSKALDKLHDGFDFQATIPRTLDSMDSFMADLRERLTAQPVDIISSVFGGRNANDLIAQVQGQLDQALGQSHLLEGMDPHAAQQFLQLRTDQIQELADLQEQLLNASGPEAAALQQRIQRISEAQGLELQSFLSQIEGIGSILPQLLASVSPPASAGQIATIPQANSNTYAPQFNLGVTTNNSPAAVYQSYQTMQALYS